MDDVYLNLFYSYEQGDYANLDREKTLENNLTRSLIIVLKSEPSLLKTFISKFICGDKSDLDISVVKYHLQKNPNINLSRYTKKYLLGVSPSKSIIHETPKIPNILRNNDDNKTNLHARQKLKDFHRKYFDNKYNAYKKGAEIEFKIQFDVDIKIDKITPAYIRYLYDYSNGSRPDAWIVFPETMVIAIENKIVGSLNNVQLDRHITKSLKLELNKKKSILKCITWEEIFIFFNDIKIKPNNKYLVTDFVKYLRRLGMSNEMKFESRHFEYFNSNGSDEDKQDIQARLERISKSIISDDRFNKKKYTKYENGEYYYPFNLKADGGCYNSICQLKSKKSNIKSKKPTENFNISYGLNRDSVTIEIWMKYNKLEKYIGKRNKKWLNYKEFGEDLWNKIQKINYNYKLTLQTTELLKKIKIVDLIHVIRNLQQ